jgi:hypothetical protein
MSFQFSVTLRTNAAGTIESTIGTAPLLRLMTGTVPATCATAQSGTQLYSVALPSDFLTTASAGAVTLNGSWTGAASSAGTVGYFRILDSAGTNCHVQGTVTATGGGGDMTLDNVVLAASQAFTVTSFSVTMGGA